MMIKAIATIILFIVHTVFITKVGLLFGTYLLTSRMIEIYNTPAKIVNMERQPKPQATSLDDFFLTIIDQNDPSIESLYENQLLQSQMNEYTSLPPLSRNDYINQHQYQHQDPYNNQYQYQKVSQPLHYQPQNKKEDSRTPGLYTRPFTYRLKTSRNHSNLLSHNIRKSTGPWKYDLLRSTEVPMKDGYG